MIGYGNSMFLATHGILARSASGGGVDPDAQAFITAASITDPTQQSAINTLVTDLKGYGIWTKMKAIYPFVGGTSSTHKWNLKDPRDLDAAFRLVFNGGWTHSSTGATPNGTNAYADTKLLASTQLSLNSTHISVYSRTNTDILAPSIANATGAVNNESSLWLRATNLSYLRVNTPTASTQSTTDSRGTFIGNRNSSTQQQLMVRGTRYDFSVNSNSLNSTTNYSLSGLNGNIFWDTKQLAFASIGDGLTNQNMTDLTTAVQAFQTTLGRSIGTQTVSDADAQAFVTNAGIVDQVEANAINNLVIGLKADGLWTKIYAAYPMVGGTSTSTSYNLKNTSQYQISWNGGWTWNNNGVTPNGTNGFGNTGFNPVTVGITKTNFGVSAYSRTNIVQSGCLIGIVSGTSYIDVRPRLSSTIDFLGCYDDSNALGNYLTDSLGLFTAVRTGTTQKFYQGATEKSQRTGFAATADINGNIYIGARNFVGVGIDAYSTKQTAWVAFHEFFDATQQANYSNRIQTFQTALARQV